MSKSSLLSHIAFLAVVACSVCTPSALAAEDRPAEANQVQIRGYAQIGLQVTDTDRAIAFYRDVMQLPLLFSANGMTFFQVGNSRLMIERGEPGHSATLYFDDENLDAARQRLEAAGVKFTGPTETVLHGAGYDLKLAEFSDPDGNPLALMGKVERQD